MAEFLLRRNLQADLYKLTTATLNLKKNIYLNQLLVLNLYSSHKRADLKTPALF